MEPVLVGCSHGTADPRGQAVVASLLDAVRHARPGLEVVEAYVDVQTPEVAPVVAEHVRAGRSVVVVPLLLSAGYHVHVDVRRAVEQGGSAGAGRATAAGALGPDPRLVAMLVDRLAQSGATPEDEVVLAAAGSSDARAVADVEQVVAELAVLRGGPVRAAYASAAEPPVPQAVQDARASGGRVVVASYLLAPGVFHTRLAEAGADVVTAPLAPDPRLVEIVLDRYDAARA